MLEVFLGRHVPGIRTIRKFELANGGTKIPLMLGGRAKDLLQDKVPFSSFATGSAVHGVKPMTCHKIEAK